MLVQLELVRIGLVWFSCECRQPLETETAALADESAVLVEEKHKKKKTARDKD